MTFGGLVFYRLAFYRALASCARYKLAIKERNEIGIASLKFAPSIDPSVEPLSLDQTIVVFRR